MTVFGLGNPGAKYSGTRHNAGFETVERIAAQKGMRLRKRCFRCYRRAVLDDLVLVQPLTFMNNSGLAVPDNITSASDMIVIVDQMDLPPGKGYQALKTLQDCGFVDSIITRRIAGLEERAGCRNVLNMKGTVYDNVCPGCGRHYPVEYMRDAKGVPLCEACMAAIRPQVCLFGEMINNAVMTRAAEEVSKADTLLVLGANLTSTLCSQLIQYYTGSSLILVTETEHYSDQRADIVIHSRSDEFLASMVSEYKKENL